MTNTYPEPVAKLLALGRPENPWLEYGALGLTARDIPELIRLVEDDELRYMESPDKKDLPEWYAQMHAWRALGQLGGEEAIPALLGILHQIDDDQDDWLSSDAPDVFALLGVPAIEPLASYLGDEDNLMFARGAASSSLARIAATHPQARERCIQAITAVLENYGENDESLNGVLIGDLMDLKAVDQIDLIRRAFEAGAVDEMVNGDFEDVQVELGLLAERLTPARPRSFFRGAEKSEDPVFLSLKTTADRKKEKNKRKQEKKSRKKNRRKK